MAKEIKAGDAVILHGLNGNVYAANCDRVKEGGLIDLTYADPRQMGPNNRPRKFQITDSPRDDEGKRPDSWRPA